MAMTFALICVADVIDDESKLKRSMNIMKDSICDIDGKLSYDAIIHVNNIMEHITCVTDNNKYNVVIIIGSSSVRNIVSEVIQEIADKEILYPKLATMMLHLAESLNTMLHQSTFGIRNQTLIINMSGSAKKAAMWLSKNEAVILEITFFILENGEDNIFMSETPREELMDIENVADRNEEDDIFMSETPREELMDIENVADRNKEILSYSSNSFEDTDDNTVQTMDNVHENLNVLDVEEMNTKNAADKDEGVSSLRISVKKAMEIIKDIVHKDLNIMHIENVNINNAYGRILYNRTYSKCNVPPFETAVKHGFAVIANDRINTKRIMRTYNTSTPFKLEHGTCVYVENGAPIPDGATAVVQIENTQIVPKKHSNNNTDIQEKRIAIMIEPKKGENIRPIGYEIGKGDKILDGCTRIGITEIGLLACCGHKEVTVVKRPSIGILSIGDELEEPGKILRPGHIYDSNRITLISLLKENSFDSIDFGIVPYELSSIISKILETMTKVDVLVIIGCANDKDILKIILKGCFEATIHFGGVDIKPGKSTAFATCTFNDRKKYFLCLSGNPATVPITAYLFLLPLLDELYCHHHQMPIVEIPALVRSRYDLHPRPKYIWTVLKWNESEEYATAFNTTDQNRSLIRYHHANALLPLPPRTTSLKTLPDSFVNALYIGSK